MRILLAVSVLAMALAACSGGSSDTTTDPENSTSTVSSVVSTTTSTTEADSTSTTVGVTTSTTAAATTTTSAVTATTVAGTSAPVIDITSPAPNTQFEASLNGGEYVAAVQLAADVDDPDDDEVIVTWHSDVDGDLGTGVSVEVNLTTGGFDAASHTITATATDTVGNVATATVRVQVFIPSS